MDITGVVLTETQSLIEEHKKKLFQKSASSSFPILRKPQFRVMNNGKPLETAFLVIVKACLELSYPDISIPHWVAMVL